MDTDMDCSGRFLGVEWLRARGRGASSPFMLLCNLCCTTAAHSSRCSLQSAALGSGADATTTNSCMRTTTVNHNTVCTHKPDTSKVVCGLQPRKTAVGRCMAITQQHKVPRRHPIRHPAFLQLSKLLGTTHAMHPSLSAAACLACGQLPGQLDVHSYARSA